LTYNGNSSTPIPFVPVIPLIPKQALIRDERAVRDTVEKKIKLRKNERQGK
jgi:hypothetical protein